MEPERFIDHGIQVLAAYEFRIVEIPSFTKTIKKFLPKGYYLLRVLAEFVEDMSQHCSSRITDIKDDRAQYVASAIAIL